VTPLPAPPAATTRIALAINRDSVLNPEERAARDSVPRPPALPTPAERIAPYTALFEAAGWRTETYTHRVRARVEAFHPSGVAAMVTVDLRRKKQTATVYALSAGHIRWARVRPAHVDHYIQHARLPDGAKLAPLRSRNVSKCRCHKKSYATRQRAEMILAQVRERRLESGEERDPETRVYRCEADDRAWHLTSKKHGYTSDYPLAQAFVRLSKD
jgi:hypothetical protein